MRSVAAGQVRPVGSEERLVLLYHATLVVVRLPTVHDDIGGLVGRTHAYCIAPRLRLVGAEPDVGCDRAAERDVLGLGTCLEQPAETVGVLHGFDRVISFW